jgi:hypothetical protein
MEYITKRMASQLWWADLHPYTKNELTIRFFENRVFTSLSGREIEKIFDKKDEPLQPDTGNVRLTEHKTISIKHLTEKVYGNNRS